MSLILIFVALLIVYLCISFYLESKDFPPGVPRYPVVGSIVSIGAVTGSRLLLDMAKVADKYGKIMGFIIGRMKVVIIQDFEVGKEMAFNERFTGRAVSPYSSQIRGYHGRNIGVISTEGETWKTHRRFSLSTLKEFGFGKKSMGAIIAEEAEETIDRLAEFDGKDFEVDQTFNIPVFNIIWRIVAGKRYQHDDPHIKELQRLLTEVFKSAFRSMPFPLISKIFPSFAKTEEKKIHVSKMKAMFEEVVEEHMKDFDADAKPRDFIDMYIKEMSSNSAFNHSDLIGICMDFFEAGGETVGSTLAWILMYLAMHQEQQEKCFQEIDKTIGKRVPTLDDKVSLPNCEATIMEIQRISCVAPGSLDHKVLDGEAVLEGYKIPRDTLVFYNICTFHMSPKYWKDPEEFNPGRFLKQDENSGIPKVVKLEQFVPFGMGRRICMGESLAKAELFIFTVMLIQRLEFLPPKFSSKMDPNNDMAGVTRSPNPFHVHIRVR